MREIAALAVGFLMVIVMLYRKIHIGTTMLVTSIATGFIAGFSPLEVINVLMTSITEKATVQLLAVVTIIAILSYLLQKFGVLNKMADSLEELFNNNWFSLMFLPLLVGVLSVPGGAVISAPVVDSVGEKMELNNIRKSAINVVFRHLGFFLFPFSTPIILSSQISGVSPYTIIKYNAPIGLVSVIAGYMLYIRGSVTGMEDRDKNQNKRLTNRIGTALMYTSPLWIGVVLNLAFGVPFYLAFVPGIAAAYFLSGKEKEGFVKEISRGINWKMIYAVAGIMCLQGFIKRMPATAQSINTLMESGMDIRILVVISTASIGLLTANSSAVNGMVLPLFLPLAGTIYSKEYITSLVFASAFMFYFITPVHLCQIFTAEYFDVNIKDLFAEYKLYWPLLFGTMLVLYVFIY